MYQTQGVTVSKMGGNCIILGGDCIKPLNLARKRHKLGRAKAGDPGGYNMIPKHDSKLVFSLSGSTWVEHEVAPGRRLGRLTRPSHTYSDIADIAFCSSSVCFVPLVGASFKVCTISTLNFNVYPSHISASHCRIPVPTGIYTHVSVTIVMFGGGEILWPSPAWQIHCQSLRVH